MLMPLLEADALALAFTYADTTGRPMALSAPAVKSNTATSGAEVKRDAAGRGLRRLRLGG
jgi:hypothetical protein